MALALAKFHRRKINYYPPTIVLKHPVRRSVLCFGTKINTLTRLMKISTFTRFFSFKKIVPSKISYTKIFVRYLAFHERSHSKLVTMKLDSPHFNAIFTPEVNALSEIFQRHQFELRMAGGAVRDLLMDKPPDDIDFATTATPDEMKKMFEAEKIRMLHRKGEAHGTVTVRIHDKQNFEITTLRVDTATDGRHAEVQFTTDWQLDAGRRDLTINAMFLDLKGIVYDYFNGREDLKNKQVRFVGDPNIRIQEDFLRILRYFRFYGRIATKPDCHDSETLEAIKKHSHGLGKIAGERLCTELKKILSGNYAKEIIVTMLDSGIGPYIGLPDSPNIEEYKDVCDRARGMKPHPLTRLAALLKTVEDVMTLHSRLKFSKYDRDLTLFVVENRNLTCHSSLKPFFYLIMNTKFKTSDVQEWSCEVLKYQGNVSMFKELSKWKPPKFPLSGHVLKEKGYKPGPKMNEIMQALRIFWIDSEFKLTDKDLLDHLDKNMHGDG